MMAEDGIHIPVTPEIIELEVGNIRTNSTRKIGVANNGAKILPHYLRASTGSCHDLCKYGQKHAFEAKAKSPMSKRITATPGEGQYLEKTQTLAKKKFQTLSVIKREVSSLAKKLGVSKKDSSPGKGTDVFTRLASASKLKPTKSSSVPTPGRSSIKRNSDIRNNPLGGSSFLRNSEIGINNEMGTSKMGEKEFLVLPAVSLSPRPSVKRVASINAGNYKKLKGMSHLKNQNNASKGEPEQGSDKKILEKTLYIIESEAENKTIGPAQNGTHTTQMGTSKMGEKEVLVPPAVSLSPRPSVKRVASLNAGNYKKLKGMSHLKNQNNARKAEPELGSDKKVLEKTLYIIEPEAENKTIGPAQNGTHTTQLSPSSKDKSLRCAHYRIQTAQSFPSSENKNLSHTRNGIRTTRSPSSSENKSLRRTRNGIRSTQSSSCPSLSFFMFPSESTLSREYGTISEHDETETKKQLENRKEEYMIWPRRGGITNSEDKDRQPWKLNFRRGKVVDLQSENNGPRRLRFRRGRVLGENQCGKDDTKRRSYRWREVIDSELYGNNTETERVVLRHRDVEGKKDAQSLFNNVIEETASKLAETRKSKVKVLVGAFETVISLQETRPSVVTSTY